MLIDTPNIEMRKNEPQKAMAMPALTQKATAGRRKMPRTVITRIRPSKPVLAQDRQTVAILLRLVGDNRQTYRVGKGCSGGAPAGRTPRSRTVKRHLGADPEHLQVDGPLTVVQELLVRLPVAVDHLRPRHEDAPGCHRPGRSA